MKLHGMIVEAAALKSPLALAIKDEFECSDSRVKEIIRYLNDELDPDNMNIGTWEMIYNHFQDEMPYGTQKARTGDPYQWIADKMSRMFGKLL